MLYMIHSSNSILVGNLKIPSSSSNDPTSIAANVRTILSLPESLRCVSPARNYHPLPVKGIFMGLSVLSYVIHNTLLIIIPEIFRCFVKSL